MQERRNSIANTMELRLSCTNISIYCLNSNKYIESNLDEVAYHRHERCRKPRVQWHTRLRCPHRCPQMSDLSEVLPVRRHYSSWRLSILWRRLAGRYLYAMKNILLKSLWWIYLGKNKIYLDFLSFLNTEMTQVVEIFPQWRQWPIYPV